jgi:hypothetical protein
MHDTYKNWIQKERNGFWTNQDTGESTIWHPMTIEIAEPLYQKASKWCRKAADDRNKRTKDK